MKLLVSCLAAILAGAALSLNSAGQFSRTQGPQKADAEAQALVRDLLSQRPAKPTVLTGRFKIRDAENKRREIRFSYSVQPGQETWQGIYQTEATSRVASEKLIVIHRGEQPNQYLYTRARDPGIQPGEPVSLSGPEAAIPFAGTDFWLADLGLDFLHWPEQRLIKDTKITMWNGRPYQVLESINPNPTGPSYARVVSRIDRETGGLLKAEAYATGQTKPFKVFSLKHFKKGEVKEMEIRNENADSRTQLEFSFAED